MTTCRLAFPSSLLVLLAVFLLCPADASAQAFNQCVSDGRDATAYGPGQSADASRPGSTTVLGSPKSLIVAARDCAGQYAEDVLIADYGFPLFYALALIIVVWTGLQIMFGGQFSLGEVVNLAFLLGVPYAILTYYTTPAPFLGGYTFPVMVTEMGSTVAENLVEGAYEQFATLVGRVTGTFWDQANVIQSVRELSAAAHEATEENPGLVSRVIWFFVPDFGIGSPGELYGTVLRSIVSWFMALVVSAFALVILVLMLIPAVITYCSYLWGQIALLVAVVIGPLFVPMMLIPQLSFLFWGWFKSLLGASVHMMIAGAVFAVSAQLLSIPLVRLETVFSDLLKPEVWTKYDLAAPAILLSGLVLETIPLWLIAMLGAFKVGELTSLIMNGGAMPASGLGDRMRQMGQARSAGSAAMGMMAGGGAAAAGAAVATGGAALAAQAAGQVLSSATKLGK